MALLINNNYIKITNNFKKSSSLYYEIMSYNTKLDRDKEKEDEEIILYTLEEMKKSLQSMPLNESSVVSKGVILLEQYMYHYFGKPYYKDDKDAVNFVRLNYTTLQKYGFLEYWLVNPMERIGSYVLSTSEYEKDKETTLEDVYNIYKKQLDKSKINYQNC